jgi:hypothetical protein
MAKKFKVTREEIQPLAEGHGGCIASDMITVEGYPVRFMYREKYDSRRPEDSGWRFLSGFEDDDYMNDANNHSIYDVNTIANYDPCIIPFLDFPPGIAFEKSEGKTEFERVEDWLPPEN